MEFEIRISGKKEPLSLIQCMFKRSIINDLCFKNLNDTDQNSVLSIYTKEESLNDALSALSYILNELKGKFPDFEPEIRVRNLSYSEPEIGHGHKSPLRPTRAIRIIPPGFNYFYENGITEIIIDSHNAFGSGNHPSTILCLEQLEGLSAINNRENNNWLKGKRVLDFGCGTGILAIASIKLGAKCAVGIEMDHNSFITVKKNVQYNDLGDRIEIVEGSWNQLCGDFDLIIANLVPSALLKAPNIFLKHIRPDGRIIISGFGIKQCASIINPFLSSGFNLIQKKSLKEWCSFLLKYDTCSIPVCR